MTIETFGLKAVRFVDRVTDTMAEIVFIVILIFSAYSLWDSNQVYTAADSTNYTAYRPTVDDSVSFDELCAMNPDIFGWLTVNDTPIDYPLVRGKDNNRYVNYSAEGKYSLSGAIFLDYRNSLSFDDFNSIIYGHHMEKKMMFGSLSDFSDKEYFDNHPYGNLYFNGTDHGLVFFALVLTDAYDGTMFSPALSGEEKRQGYIDRIMNNAVHTRDVPLTPEDQLIVLSTCTTDITNGRYMLVGKIDDELHLPPVEEEAPKPIVRGKGIDRQKDFLSGIPLWGWVLIVWTWVGFIAILYFALLVLRARRQGGGE